MNWYAAHLVMVVKLKGRPQRSFPAWENIVLVRAASEQAALAQAESLGRASAGDDDGTFRWGGKDAAWEFAGVRKVTECAFAGAKPTSGDEVTYSELVFDSLANAKRYARGAAMSVRHDDQIRTLDDVELEIEDKPKRKRA
jgi:hypothetical protein